MRTFATSLRTVALLGVLLALAVGSAQALENRKLLQAPGTPGPQVGSITPIVLPPALSSAADDRSARRPPLPKRRPLCLQETLVFSPASFGASRASCSTHPSTRRTSSRPSSPLAFTLAASVSFRPLLSTAKKVRLIQR